MKIWFLILAAVVLSGCESPQVARQREMQEVRRLAAASGLSPEQQAQLAAIMYAQMEADRNENARVSAALISEGFQNAGRQISEGSRYHPNFMTPTPPMPQLVIPTAAPIQNYQIDTPQYQRFNGASPGNIHY